MSWQRDSGDDEDMEKNSEEDEEGQLEEQIERLQEKVESAQSEQKNLFLVIFQVRLLKNISKARSTGKYLEKQAHFYVFCPFIHTKTVLYH